MENKRKEMINKILKNIVIYGSYKEKREIRREIIKREIIRLLELINIRINKVTERILLSRKRLLSRINRLEKLNHINDYKLISYNYNKNNMILKGIISKLIINLLENIINGVDLKSGKSRVSGGNIIISKPVIKENIKEVKILFYYFLPNNKSYKYFSRINMYLNKIRNYKELVRFNNKYNKSIFMGHDKLIISNIFNNIIENRNNVKVVNKDINKIINELNKNYNSKLEKLLNKGLNKNLLNINKLPSKLLINSTLLNVLILKNNSNKIKLNEEKIKNNIKLLSNNVLLHNNNNIYNIINSNNNNNINLISKCNMHNKVKLERKDLVLNYILKNEIMKNNNINNNILIDNSDINLFEVNKLNNKNNILGYMVSYIDILLGNIINKDMKSNDIKMIISKYFGLKDVNIEGINLKYEFNNPEILLKLIRKGISKRKRTISHMFRFRLKNRIPLLNDKGILKNKISNNLLKNLSLNNNILNVENNIKNVLLNSINSYNKINNNIYNDIKDYYNNLSMKSENDVNTLNNDLLYKYIVG